jgi:hypothetical protein
MNQNELPENYNIDEDIFFGDDDKKEINLKSGRPKKTDEEICSSEQITKKKVSGPSVETMRKNKDILTKANFLKVFEDRVQRRSIQEEAQRAEKERLKRDKLQRKEKLNPGPKLKRAQPNAARLQDLSNCAEHQLDHEYVFDFLDGKSGAVFTRCKHCSKERQWYPLEWRKYQGFAPIAVNPNPSIFPI